MVNNSIKVVDSMKNGGILMNKRLKWHSIFVNPRLKIKRYMSISIVICLLLALFVPVRAEAYTDSDFMFYDISMSHNGEVVGSDDTVTIEVKLNTTFDNKSVFACFDMFYKNENGSIKEGSQIIGLTNIYDNVYQGVLNFKNTDLFKKDFSDGKYYLNRFGCYVFNMKYNETIGENVTTDYFTYYTPFEKSEEYKQYYVYYSDECKSTNTHLFDSGEITKYPTPTEPGEKTYTCERCGYKSIETIPIDNQTNIEDNDTNSGKDDNSITLSGITPKIKYLKSTKKKQLTIKYDEIPNVEYYHIIVSTDKRGVSNRKEYKTTKTSYVIKKLKSKKTYYIKVRGCIGVFYDEEGEEHARNATLFSSTKKVKIK